MKKLKFANFKIPGTLGNARSLNRFDLEAMSWAHALEWLRHVELARRAPHNSSDGDALVNRHISVLQMAESANEIKARSAVFEDLRKVTLKRPLGRSERMELRVREINSQKLNTNLSASIDDVISRENSIDSKPGALDAALQIYRMMSHENTLLLKKLRLMMFLRFADGQGYNFATATVRGLDDKLYYFFFNPLSGENGVQLGRGETVTESLKQFLEQACKAVHQQTSSILRFSWVNCKR